MIVVQAGHAHELSIFVAVPVIFYVKSAVMRILFIFTFFKLTIESKDMGSYA
jgi:hypothetical protein